MIKIRLFEKQDTEQVARLFHETVREINIRDYSSDQVEAWAPSNIHFRDWAEVCSNRFTYVADDEGIIAGFGELKPNGHIDCFYCHTDYQRCRVGSQIYRAIEAKAFDLGVGQLITEASITAKPFFQRMGFSIVKKQQVACRGEIFVNYIMKKLLKKSIHMILETKRLVLKPILESELNALHMIFTDSYVRRYLCDDKIFSLQQVEEMLIQSRKHFEEERFGLWFIETNSEREVIGFVGLWYFFDEEQPQLIYALLPKALKRGYATEAATKIITYCFDELGYEHLVASCDQPNLESQKVAERLGMKKVEKRIVNGNPILFFRIEKS